MPAVRPPGRGLFIFKVDSKQFFHRRVSRRDIVLSETIFEY